ncbi:MAG: DUF924 family protein [Spirochaetota bacterium]
MQIHSEAQKVITFWFEECKEEQHFQKDAAFDKLIQERFVSSHQIVTSGESYEWRSSIQGRLAEVLVLDQFSRNIFRDTAKAFLYDPLALVLAQEALLQEDLSKLSIKEKSFLYMPFMHSESLKIHAIAEKLFAEKGMEKMLKYEIMHKEIIERFGRYPHRNQFLGRTSTEEELEFLNGPNSSF